MSPLRSAIWLALLLFAFGFALDTAAASKTRRAHALRAPEALARWLRAIDATPTATELAASHARAAHWLDRVARDGPTPMIVRHRAVALLAILPQRRADRRLRVLLTTAKAPIRATAALAWASGPGRRHPASAATVMAHVLGDRAVTVRMAAARSLVLFGDKALARSLAVQRRAIEPNDGVRSSLDATIRRLDRESRRAR